MGNEGAANFNKCSCEFAFMIILQYILHNLSEVYEKFYYSIHSCQVPMMDIRS